MRDRFRPVFRFLSTPSARRATETGAMSVTPINISIHALREEGDALRARITGFILFISIHALREEGDFALLAWAARIAISIHALREEGDGAPQALPLLLNNFYPRPPRGGRRQHARRQRRMAYISIHALREEGDRLVRGRQRRGKLISIHALREEGDLTILILYTDRC